MGAHEVGLHPTYRRRSRTPLGRGFGPNGYERRRSPPRRFSPRREERIRSPPAIWRSKSPFNDGRSRDSSRGHNSPRRPRDATPGTQGFRPSRRDGPPAPSLDKSLELLRQEHRQKFCRRKVPAPGPRGDHAPDRTSQDRILSSRHASPAQVVASQSETISQRSSPAVEKAGFVSQGSRSRSPVHLGPQRSSKPPGRSPFQDQIPDTDSSVIPRRSEHGERLSLNNQSPAFNSEKMQDQHQMSGPRVNNIPTQPKNHSASPHYLPTSGPYQGPRPPSNPHRGVLSAPTRPRRGPGSRESWMGTPPVRRGPAPASHGPPAGPRGSFSSSVTGGGSFRHATPRQSISASAAQPAPSRGGNHLAGLCTIIPEGRCLPSLLEPAVEKRLSQLDTDKEKLLEQMAEMQRSKRAELRDWDRLDRESSICALKSELAEGNLQRMADESIGGGILF